MVRPTKIRKTRGQQAEVFFAVFAACLGAFFVGSVAPVEASAQLGPTPPNILFIIGDDHGWPYFGFMGDPLIQTPQIDALALNGTTFAYGYSTASVCSPSLQTLLTGLHPAPSLSQKADGVFLPQRPGVGLSPSGKAVGAPSGSRPCSAIRQQHQAFQVAPSKSKFAMASRR